MSLRWRVSAPAACCVCVCVRKCLSSLVLSNVYVAIYNSVLSFFVSPVLQSRRIHLLNSSWRLRTCAWEADPGRDWVRETV
jgi:hypothetical protein